MAATRFGVVAQAGLCSHSRGQYIFKPRLRGKRAAGAKLRGEAGKRAGQRLRGLAGEVGNVDNLRRVGAGNEPTPKTADIVEFHYQVSMEFLLDSGIESYGIGS